MQEDRSVLRDVHFHFLESEADLLDDCFGRIGLDNRATVAQQVEEEPIRDCGSIGYTAALHPRDASVGEFPMEFGNQPRLANAGLADDADYLALPAFDQLKEIMQNGALVVAVDKSRRARRGRLAQSGAAMRHIKQAISRNGL